MFFDVYMIILTAFALLGRFFLLEMIISDIQSINTPHSVTIMKYSKDEKAIRKIDYIYNNIPNNEVIFLSEKDENTEFPQVKVCEISSYLSNVLFTKDDT